MSAAAAARTAVLLKIAKRCAMQPCPADVPPTARPCLAAPVVEGALRPALTRVYPVGTILPCLRAV